MRHKDFFCSCSFRAGHNSCISTDMLLEMPCASTRDGLFLKLWGSIKLRGDNWVGGRPQVVDTEESNIRDWRKKSPLY